MRTLALALVLALPCLAHAADKVVLQLAWEHQFQFAGYYAALWQGYYDAAGLDVQIQSAYRSNGSAINVVDEVVTGRAQFGIGSSNLLLAIDAGQPISILAPIFQKSPAAVASLKQVPLSSPQDLVGLTIASDKVNPMAMELRALLAYHGLDPDSVNFVDLPKTFQTLLDNKADAILTYAPPAPYFAHEAGVEFNLLLPVEHGVKFYGDTLFTHRELTQSDPELVERFIKASARGWHYALHNKAEMVERISHDLPRYRYPARDAYALNQAFADQIDELMVYPYVEVGQNSVPRWHQIHDALRELGFVDHAFSEAAVYQPTVNGKLSRILVFGGASLALLALIIAALLFLRHLANIVQASIIFAVVLIMVSTEAWLEHQLLQRSKDQARYTALQSAYAVQAKLQASLDASLSLIQGFAAHLSIHPDIEKDEFDAYASQLIDSDSALINFAAAPDLVVKFVYPQAGNEKAVGLDYLSHPVQKYGVIKARDSKSLVVAGPVELVQGGLAFIGRAPVYYTDPDDGSERFWGIISAPIDAQKVYQQVGLYDTTYFDVAIRQRLPDGTPGPVFFGESEIFAESTVSTEFKVADSIWQIALKLRNAQARDDLIWPLRIGSLMLLALIFAVAYSRMRNDADRQQFVNRLQFREQLLQHVGQLAAIGGWEYDCKTHRLTATDEIYRIYRTPPGSYLPPLEQHTPLYHPDFQQTVEQSIKRALEQGIPFDSELLLSSRLTGEDNQVWVRCIGTPEMEHGIVTKVRGATQDITQQKQADATILRQANYDSLTGLPNRNLFDEKLNQLIADALRNSETFALFFIDLDHFKSINDSLGHEVGDALIKSVAARLSRCIRESDVLSRRSGDEFTLLLTHIHKLGSVDLFAQQMLEELSRPFVIGAQTIHVSGSIGITIFPNDAQSRSELLKNADQAMYAAKEQGRNAFHYFTPAMQQQSDQRLQLHVELTEALEQGQLDVHYQPIVDLRSGEITKVEALVRWIHPQRGFIPPDLFIPIAEDFGLIRRIGSFVTTRACSDIMHLEAQTGFAIGLAINKSTPEFTHTNEKGNDWVDFLIRSPLAERLTVEITESLLMDKNQQVKSVLKQLKAAGITIAIDDFGTGYSSLSYLKRFPVDIVKIDRTFIRDIADDPNDKALVEAILAMTASLQLAVVAEGVETEQHETILKHNRCDFAQGYYYSKPLPINELIHLIRRRATNHNNV